MFRRTRYVPSPQRLSLKAAQGLRPSRPQGVSPGFRASLVQPCALLRPFHSRCAPFQGWEIPLTLQLLPPPSPGGVRHVCTCHRPDLRAKASATAEGGGIHEHQRHRHSRYPVHTESQ